MLNVFECFLDPIGDVKNEDKERSPDIHEGDVHDGDGLGNGDGLKEEDEIEVINQGAICSFLFY
jgi:hypothetical protein